MRLMGWEGMWGMMLSVFFLAIIEHGRCPFPEHSCVKGRIDVHGEALRKLGDSSFHVVMLIGFIVANALFNGFGIIVTKRLNAMGRTVVT